MSDRAALGPRGRDPWASAYCGFCRKSDRKFRRHPGLAAMDSSGSLGMGRPSLLGLAPSWYAGGRRPAQSSLMERVVMVCGGHSPQGHVSIVARNWLRPLPGSSSRAAKAPWQSRRLLGDDGPHGQAGQVTAFSWAESLMMAVHLFIPYNSYFSIRSRLICSAVLNYCQHSRGDSVTHILTPWLPRSLLVAAAGLSHHGTAFSGRGPGPGTPMAQCQPGLRAWLLCSIGILVSD